VATQGIRHASRAGRQVSASPVAFSALASHTLSHLGAGQNLIFEKTNVNTNNVYNPHHGVFTAPVPGIYLITTSITAHNNQENHCDIVLNGHLVAQIYTRGTDNRYDQGSQTILLHLKQGDDVSIQNDDLNDTIHGGLYTTFSGFLLFEEEPTTIVG